MKKVTMVFNYRSEKGRAGGWTESWYYDGDFTAAKSKLDELCTVRSQMLPLSILINGQRIADITNVQKDTGRSISYDVNFPGGQARLTQDVPQMALLCASVSADDLSTKRFTLRGMPDDTVIGGDFGGAGGMAGIFVDFAAKLGQGFNFRTNSPGNPKIGIDQVSNLGIFKLTGDLVYNVGDTVRIYRCKDVNGLPFGGPFIVGAKLDSRNGTFSNWPGAVIRNSGSVRVISYSFRVVVPEKCRIERATVRKVGRPSIVYRGRARKRR